MMHWIRHAIPFVLLGMLASAGQGQTGRFRMSRWQQNNPLAIQDVAVLTTGPVCGKRVELRIDLTGTFRSPFDPDEIAVDAVFHTPSGKVLKVPAFFYQRFERRIGGSHEGKNAENLVAPGPPEWRVRFLPQEPGSYRVEVQARDRSGVVTAEPALFNVNAEPFHGFIRVSAKDAHYFEFEDGTPYFAIGMNLAEGPLAEYYRWIPRLTKSGGNFARIWLGHPNFTPELGRMAEYRLENAWCFDQVLELAEEHGLYLKLCIDWIRSITPPGEGAHKFSVEDYPYGIRNGGPCQDMKDFFTLPEARRRFQNRLRYIVARWAYSPNVMAWELWNEFSTVEHKDLSREELVAWSADMIRHLKAVDPWDHLTTNSLGSGAVWPEMWQMREHDFTQMHGYYYFTKDAREDAKDMAGFMIKSLDRLTSFGKPRLFAEFGLVPEVPEIAALGDPDPAGIHFHNGLWAPLAHGAAGTGHIWYWGQYVDPKNLYYHFQAVARFADGVPWATAGFQPAKATSNRDELRVAGLQGKSMTLLWLQNKAHTWWNAAHNIPMPPVESAVVQLSGMADGAYHIEFWDTYSGRVGNTAKVQAADGALRLVVPVIERDIAIKLLSTP